MSVAQEPPGPFLNIQMVWPLMLLHKNSADGRQGGCSEACCQQTKCYSLAYLMSPPNVAFTVADCANNCRAVELAQTPHEGRLHEKERFGSDRRVRATKARIESI